MASTAASAAYKSSVEAADAAQSAAGNPFAATGGSADAVAAAKAAEVATHAASSGEWLLLSHCLISTLLTLILNHNLRH